MYDLLIHPSIQQSIYYIVLIKQGQREAGADPS